MPSGAWRSIILIDAEGPRGGRHEYTVYIDRQGRVEGVARTAPTTTYLSPEEAPPELAKAAFAALDGQ